MPITAKFSRDFYDRFGHEAVDELVNFLNRIDAGYRSELTELNERNWARFEDRLERRVAELDAKIDQRTAELPAELKAGLAAMESRLVRWMFVFVATGTLAVLGLG